MTQEQNQADLVEIELSIELAQKQVKQADLLEKLYKNADFKELMVDGFLRDYAVQMVKLKAHPTMKSDEDQKQITLKIDSIGTLNQFFQMIFAQGHQADIAIAQAEAAREDIEAEEAASDGEN